MIQLARTVNIKEIYQYIGNEYYKCIYLYLDLKRYGIEDDNNVKCWIEKNDNDRDNITAVLLQYYTGMHIFSKDKNSNFKEISKLILKQKPTMICGEADIIKNIYKHIADFNYCVEYGWVRELTQLTYNVNCNYCIEKAAYSDFDSIAQLLYNDEDIGASYDVKNLAEQLYIRNKEGYARNYVIKKENKVVSHAATGAENEELAMLAYVITEPSERGKGYAKEICYALCKDVINEGKKIYLINYSNESSALYEKLGFKICSNWGKIFFNLKEK